MHGTTFGPLLINKCSFLFVLILLLIDLIVSIIVVLTIEAVKI